MISVYSFTQGDSPLLVSMPHSGEQLPEWLIPRMTESGRALVDTDWYLPRLYNFLSETGASVLSANFSRYVVDLNRPVDGGSLYPGQRETEVCPTTSFMDQPLYLDGALPDEVEIAERIEQYWRPYHLKLESELTRIKDRFGYALLWDAHSIQSRLPRFFEGCLPDLNLGSADSLACDESISRQLLAVLRDSPQFTFADNGRFKGGYITRHYGEPGARIHAVQMEIAQICYMSEYPDFRFSEERAEHLRKLLRRMIEVFSQSHG